MLSRGLLLRLNLSLSLLVAVSGCGSSPETADLGVIYNEAAQHSGTGRNPVVVLPGILGSKLEEPGTNKPIWGSWIYGAADPDTPEGARLVALPMERGRPLSQLRDDIIPTEVLDTVTLDVALIRGVEFAAYSDILKTLAAGKYRDQTIGKAGAVDYAGLHYTCFQFPYDWRRDISEQAMALHEQILNAIALAGEAEGVDGPTKVDIVAHSMGGLVVRYYLRYGPHPLPEDGSMPELTWEGTRNVERVILVGTPSAGSVLSLRQLVKGVQYASLITPKYEAAVLGTMPAIYQLLPRPRHQRVVDAETDEPIDILDPEVWRKYEWGLADPEQERVIANLLPDVKDPGERRAIALDQLDKCLAKTRQLFEALDRPATPPPGCEIRLIAGDAQETPDVLAVNPRTGRVSIRSSAPGDGTVTRASALMDERVGSPFVPRLRSPVAWHSVHFLSSNHIELTRDPAFGDSVLYTLLEEPRLEDKTPEANP